MARNLEDETPQIPNGQPAAEEKVVFVTMEQAIIQNLNAMHELLLQINEKTDKFLSALKSTQ